MTDFRHRFIEHLQGLHERNRGALAELRRSLGFAPGTYPAAFPSIEPFAAQGTTREAERQALYLAAGLYALHPSHQAGSSLASVLAQVRQARNSDSIEKRFIALLSGDDEALPVHLRHAVALVAADGRGIDFELLLGDITVWLDPWQTEPRDRIRQRWASDFYRTTAAGDSEPESTSASQATEPAAE